MTKEKLTREELVNLLVNLSDGLFYSPREIMYHTGMSKDAAEEVFEKITRAQTEFNSRWTNG